MRIYLSSTVKDLESHRRAVIAALSRTPHTVVCMEHEPARDVFPLQKVLADVASCDVYVGVFAWRYGFRPPPKRDSSITELEYRKAAECAGVEKLIFLSPDRTDWQPELVDTGQDLVDMTALRHELQDSSWVRPFGSPDSLATEVLAAVLCVYQDMMEKKLRVIQGSPTAQDKAILREGIEREIAERKEAARLWCPAHRDRIVGPVPEALILHFQDRTEELGKLHERLADRKLRMVLVCGRGGTGKTALMTKLIRRVEKDWIGKPGGGEGEVDSIVYVELKDKFFCSPDLIVERIAQTLDGDERDELLIRWHNKRSIGEGLEMLFTKSLAHGRRLIVLDNFETVLDDQNSILEEFSELRQLIEACLRLDHAALLVATSRRSLQLEPEIEGGAKTIKKEISLDAGLPPAAAVALMRELDDDGLLGARDATDDILMNVVHRCGCIPRTLKTLVGVLSPERPLGDYVSDEAEFARFLADPRSALYKSLASDEERLVIQVLSAYNHPVPAIAVRYVLPTLPVEEILERFRLNHIATYDNGRFSLHPLDQEYAYSQIPEEGDTHSQRAYARSVAAFWKELERPSVEWNTIEDLEPQLERFSHLVRAGLCDTACEILDAVDSRYLRKWGHYSTIIESREQLLGRLDDRRLARSNLAALGSAYTDTGRAREGLELLNQVIEAYSDEVTSGQMASVHNDLGAAYEQLGDHRSAEDHYNWGLEIAVRLSDRQRETALRANLGMLYLCVGEPDRAVECVSKAMEMDQELGNWREVGIDLGNLGFAYWMLGDPREALKRHEEALSIACAESDLMRQGVHKNNLGLAWLDLGEITKAVRSLSDAVDIARKVGDRVRECLILAHLGFGLACLGRLEEWRSAVSEGLDLSLRISFPRGQIRNLVCRGWCELAMDYAKEASASYCEAVQLSRSASDKFSLSRALQGIGVAHHRLGGLSEARTALAEAYDLGFARNQYACSVRLGMLCLQADEPEQARDHLSEGIRLCEVQTEKAGKLYDVLFHLGMAHLCLGRPGDALGTFRQALEVCSAKGVVQYFLGDLRLLQSSPYQPECISEATAVLEDSLATSLSDS